jgi:hypothetical protein
LAQRNVFHWLDQVRARPSLYLGDGSLKDPEFLLSGYYTALATHGVVEAVPDMNWHFLSWLYYRTGWACSRGWAYAINSRHPGGSALDAFFQLVEEYRRLRPVRLCTVQVWVFLHPGK